MRKIIPGTLLAGILVWAAPAALNAQNATANQQQKENSGDAAQKVRQAIENDKNLSAVARNVKVTLEKGNVVLRGTVADFRQREAIEKHANDIAGSEHVVDEITIATK